MKTLKILKLFLPTFILINFGPVLAWGQDSVTTTVIEPQIQFEDFTEIENPQDFSWQENFLWALQTIVDPSSLNDIVPLYVYEWHDEFCSTEYAKTTIGLYGHFNGVFLEFDNNHVYRAWSSPESYCLGTYWDPDSGVPAEILETFRELGATAILEEYGFLSDESRTDNEILNYLSYSDFLNSEASKVIGNGKSVLAGLTFSDPNSPVLVSTNKVRSLTQLGELWGWCQTVSRFDQSSACYETVQ